MVTWVETHITQGACAYPITSSTTMGGGYQVEVANGKKNLWGEELAFIEPHCQLSQISRKRVDVLVVVLRILAKILAGQFPGGPGFVKRMAEQIIFTNAIIETREKVLCGHGHLGELPILRTNRRDDKARRHLVKLQSKRTHWAFATARLPAVAL